MIPIDSFAPPSVEATSLEKGRPREAAKSREETLMDERNRNLGRAHRHGKLKRAALLPVFFSSARLLRVGNKIN